MFFLSLFQLALVSQEKKVTSYTDLLEQLPTINYNILKKLICHLYAVHELHEKNLMPLNNLAPIWGPTLMNVEVIPSNSFDSDSGFDSFCKVGSSMT